MLLVVVVGGHKQTFISVLVPKKHQLVQWKLGRQQPARSASSTFEALSSSVKNEADGWRESASLPVAYFFEMRLKVPSPDSDRTGFQVNKRHDYQRFLSDSYSSIEMIRLEIPQGSAVRVAVKGSYWVKNIQCFEVKLNRRCQQREPKRTNCEERSCVRRSFEVNRRYQHLKRTEGSCVRKTF